MGTTPTYALRYPEPSDPARDGAVAIRRLAEDVATRLGDHLSKTDASSTYLAKTDASSTYVAKSEAKLWTATATADSGQVSALTSVQSLATGTMLSGWLYRVSARGHLRGTVAADIGRVRLYDDNAGAQLRTTGFLHLTSTGSGYAYDLEAYWTGAGAARTFSARIERVSGTGLVYLNASSLEPATIVVHPMGRP